MGIVSTCAGTLNLHPLTSKIITIYNFQFGTEELTHRNSKLEICCHLF